jgi:hypothetical protein
MSMQYLALLLGSPKPTAVLTPLVRFELANSSGSLAETN